MVHNLNPTIKFQRGKTPLSTFDSKYDVILGADVIYYDKAIKALLKTCWDLSHENSLILFAFEMYET